ncbi:unnamed protein product [Allacma fusca]|uniref:Uncharacterized protein n=1 Tax=Allacma fusca TaxID=39272 RepID=A0A8J2LP29_9HEXA|nr:unnamed protein product [Allacma fusca]
MRCSYQIQREVSTEGRMQLHQSLRRLNNSASFGSSSKQSLIRKLAIALRKSSGRLAKLTSLLLVVPQNSCYEESSNGQLPNGILLAEQQSKVQKKDVWQIRWTKSLGLVTKNTRTTQVQNFANFSLKSKCAILLDMAEFTELVLRTVESNLIAMKNDSLIADKDFQSLSKRLEKHLKHHTLALNDQMYFGKLIARLKQTHKESVIFLGRLSEGMTQVVGILAVLNSYSQVMSVFTQERNSELLRKQNINSNHVVSKKIEQVQGYINEFLACPLTIHVPVKFEEQSFKN